MQRVRTPSPATIPGVFSLAEAVISILLRVLTLLGSLGVFLLGMKFMADALQRVAGERVKALLAKMTSNRISGMLTGMVVTATLQSSAATTILTVGFVSAGLFTLTQAIGVIMGANIGTTLTGWIVALVGFNLNISAIALPPIAVGMVLRFIKKEQVSQWGDVLTGFGLLFLGLSLMKNSVPSIDDPEQLAWLQQFTNHGFLSVLLFVLVGAVITAMVQSSAATMTMTLTFAAMGWIPYQLAAALILGENIGTTAAANIAAIGTTLSARRAALVHLLFNVFGVVWALLLMDVYWLPVVDLLVPGDPTVAFQLAQGDEVAMAAAAGVVATHLAVAHSLFNITNTALMLPLTKQLERIVVWAIADSGQQLSPGARFLSPAIGSAELNVVQVNKAMQHMTKLVRNMLTDALFIVSHPYDDLGTMVQKTLGVEREVDELEQEILSYLTMIGRSPISEATSRKVTELIQNTHRLERIGDHCAVIVRIARRIHLAGTPFTEESIEDIRKLYEHVDESLEHVGRYVMGKGCKEVGEQIEDLIDATRRKLRNKYVQALENEAGYRAQSLAFLDAISHLEEIGDRAVGIIRQAEET